MNSSTYEELRKVADGSILWGDTLQSQASNMLKRQWDDSTQKQRDNAIQATKNFWANSWRIPVNAASEFVTRDIPQGAVWLGGLTNGILDPSNSLFTKGGRANINSMLSDIDKFHTNYLRIPYAKGTSERIRRLNNGLTTGLSVAGQMAAARAISKLPKAVRTTVPLFDDVGNGLIATGNSFVDGLKEGLGN